MEISRPLPQNDEADESLAKFMASVSPLMGLAASTDRTMALSALQGILREMAAK